jgi:hypothetical protein
MSKVRASITLTLDTNLGHKFVHSHFSVNRKNKCIIKTPVHIDVGNTNDLSVVSKIVETPE